MAGLFRRQRVVVSNLFVALDGQAFAPVMAIVREATQRIVRAPEDFEVASAEVARVAGALLDHAAHATHGACFGEVFDDEGAAGAYAQECFADLSTRYLAAGDESERGPPPEVEPGERRVVVMLTVAYVGEEGSLEGDLESALHLEAALRAVVQLHHRGALQVAHVHVAPAHPEDRLSDEQMLANYPELMSL